MIPIGPKPAMYHILSTLAKQGFKEILMVVGYKKEQIIGYFNDGRDLGLQIDYVCEPEGVYFGTAGSLKLTEHLLDDTFIVVQGDTLFETPLREVATAHEADDGRLVTIALTEVDSPSSFGVAVFDENFRIRSFQEKPRAEEASSRFASTGIYAIDPEVLDYIESETWDFAQDLFPHLMKTDRRIGGYPDKSFWVDIGSLDGFLLGTKWILNHLVRNKHDQGVDDDGRVIVGKEVTIGKHCVTTGPALIEDHAIIGDRVRILPYTVVKEKALVSEGGIVGDGVILEHAKVGRNSSVKNSIVGEFASVGESVTIEGSVIGQGSILRDRVKVLTGSRIWPNILIGWAETVDGIVAVPGEKSFYFYLELGRYTGILARSIREFIGALRTVSVESLEFHTKRRDFEKWLREVVGSNELSDRISHLRKGNMKGENLRRALIEVLDEWTAMILDLGESKEGTSAAKSPTDLRRENLVGGEISVTR
jgi:mannose-1-phosphate guanylyltransferase